MTVLSIRIIGDPVLRTRAAEVTEFGPGTARLVEDMVETMQDVQGAGLAAPQVGVGLRIFTYNVDGVLGHVVNPVLEMGAEQQTDHDEGCLSVPGLGFPLDRAREAVVRGVDCFGVPLEIPATGVLARCFQHETDHLDGRLYIDRLDGDHRRAAMRAIRSAEYSSVAFRTAAERAQSTGSSFTSSAGPSSAGPGRRHQQVRTGGNFQ
ncbi:peptide deformylase [Arthrobacter sp. H5]|uniref:peptide deformylase n=1 Tax=Arthrobacter sp. H5 TaxID=1267973 RepID=UPI0004AE4F9D|nr:peptide deformylase [Arthrobacter sp. H5]